MFDSLELPRPSTVVAPGCPDFNAYCHFIAKAPVEGREWRRVTIEPFTDHAVSDAGEIIRLTPSRFGGRVRCRPAGHVVPQSTHHAGYKIVGLSGITYEGESTTLAVMVHRVVALAFFGPRPDGLQVAHGDGDPANNRVVNLRFATPVANAADKVLHGTARRGASHHRAKVDESAVVAIREACAVGESLDVVGARYGISRGTVGQIVSGRAWANVSGPISPPRQRRRSSESGAALTAEQAIEIIAELTINPEASRNDLGRRYGVTGSMITHIANRRAWAHLRT